MKTQRETRGYTTSYAQVRIHYGTHVDFPPHVGYDGDPTWNLSGEGRIFHPATFKANYGGETVVLFDTGGKDLPETVVDQILNEDAIALVGTDSERVGNLKTHKRLLQNGLPLVENLVNLDQPPIRKGMVFCFPTVIEGCPDGAVATVAFDPNT